MKQGEPRLTRLQGQVVKEVHFGDVRAVRPRDFDTIYYVVKGDGRRLHRTAVENLIQKRIIEHDDPHGEVDGVPLRLTDAGEQVARRRARGGWW